MFLLCRHLPKLPRLLESEDVNMRIAAGETIALLFELARDMDSVSSLSFLSYSTVQSSMGSKLLSLHAKRTIILSIFAPNCMLTWVSPCIHISLVCLLWCLSFFYSFIGHKGNISFCVPIRSLSLMTGMNCVTNWTRWPQTATSTEPRLTRGSSGRCSGTYSRLLRWVHCQLTGPWFARF